MYKRQILERLRKIKGEKDCGLPIAASQSRSNPLSQFFLKPTCVILLAFSVGCILRFSPIAEGFQYFSYAFPFLFGHSDPGDEVTILYMDAESHKVLEQPWDSHWDRALHGRLIEELMNKGAKAVVFDILFETPARPETESKFIESIRQHGNVVVGAKYRSRPLNEGMVSHSVVLPYDNLRSVASWGVVELAQENGRAWKRLTSTTEVPSLAGRSAEIAGFGGDGVSDLQQYLNYYGRPGSIRHYSYQWALQDEGIPNDAIRDKVIFVGGMSQAGFTGGRLTDDFKTPYTFATGLRSPGVEVNAVSFLNLIHDESLRRPRVLLDCLSLLIFAASFSVVIGRVSNQGAFLAAVVVGVGAFIVELLFRHWLHFWLPWGAAIAGIPVIVIGKLLLAGGRMPELILQVESRPQETLVPDIPGYRIHPRSIGSGGYGTVWLGQDRAEGYRAIKVVERGRFGSRDRLFEREFEAIRRYSKKQISHPSLIQILHLDFLEKETGFFYVMPIADDIRNGSDIHAQTYHAKTLARILERNGDLDLFRWIETSEKLIEALAVMHQNGLIHRDIKPDNVLFVEGRPCIADIGIAVTTAGSLEEQTAVGSAIYMPQDGIGLASGDVYAMGKMLSECFPRGASQALLLDNSEASLISELDAMLEKATCSSAAERFQNGQEFLAVFQSIREKLPLQKSIQSGRTE